MSFQHEKQKFNDFVLEMRGDEADVILSKGQGNYESLSGTDKIIYYLFLCKCEHFVKKFNVPKLSGIFLRS